MSYTIEDLAVIVGADWEITVSMETLWMVMSSMTSPKKCSLCRSFSRYALCGFHWKSFVQTLTFTDYVCLFLLPDELSMDRRDIEQ